MEYVSDLFFFDFFLSTFATGFLPATGTLLAPLGAMLNENFYEKQSNQQFQGWMFILCAFKDLFGSARAISANSMAPNPDADWWLSLELRPATHKISCFLRVGLGTVVGQPIINVYLSVCLLAISDFHQQMEWKHHTTSVCEEYYAWNTILIICFRCAAFRFYCIAQLEQRIS